MRFLGLSREKFRQFLGLCAIQAGGLCAMYLFEPAFLVSTFLVFGLPVLYLLLILRRRNQFSRMVTIVALFGLLYGFLLEYIAEIGGAWEVGAGTRFVFSRSLLGVVSPDVMVWFALWVAYIVLFYEHFLEKDRSQTVSWRSVLAFVPGFLVLGAVCVAHMFGSDFFVWRYAYLVLGLLTLPPVAVLAYIRPHVMHKALLTSCFFAPVYFVYELIALPQGQWVFNGEYIGGLVIGSIPAIPLEELIFWIIFSSAIVVAYYELYIDDMK